MRGVAAQAGAVRRAARTALAGLVAGLALLTVAVPAAATTAVPAALVDSTIDEVAAALEQDPVIVEEVMGNGDAAGAHDRLREVIDGSDVPIYVVLGSTPRGLSQSDPANDLAVRLRSRLGDGIFFIALTSGPPRHEAWGVPEATQFSIAVYDAYPRARDLAFPDVDWNNDSSESRPRGLSDVADAQIAATIAAGGAPWGITDDALDEIATAPWAPLPEELPRSYDEATPGGRWVVGTAVGLSVLLVGLRLLLWATASREPRRRVPASASAVLAPTRLDLADLVERANQDATRLARELADAPSSPYADSAVGYRTAAEAVLRDLDDLSSPEDKARYGRQLRDAVGALVLAKAGRHELGRAGKPGTERYVPCFFDPLHGRAFHAVSDPGRRSVDVPACRRCSEALSSGGTPRALIFPPVRRRQLRPYYEENTVWARTGYGALDGQLWATVTAERAGVDR
ncbi:hypothetical protein [Mumia sp. Pv 4-285]|uniref:hypothetical protein n=1 Tax=Mumia qirimensis TaxID=3234852 RepID=UPI00351D8C0B